MTRRRLRALLAGLVATAVVGALVAAAVPLPGITIIGVALLLVSGAGLVALGAAWRWLGRSLPMLDGELRVRGLGGTVTIRRDGRGTPYVAAESDEDLFLGLGVAMAQDRLWQMELLRRAAFGRLAELAGPELADVDAYVRTIGLGAIAEREERDLGAEEHALLAAFAAGVNLVIGGGARQASAFEFGLLRHRPEPWRVVDSLVIAKAFAWFLSSSLEASALAGRLADRIGAGEAAALFGWEQAAGVAALDLGLRAAIGEPARGSGSNAWVIGPDSSASGAPLLANDIHLGLDYSMRFYEARLDGETFRLGGLLVPGVPAVVAGSNGRIAWAPTNTGVAVSDLYVEELDEAGAAARDGAAWRPLAVRDEEIEIRGAPPRRIRIRSTRHGPLVSDLVPTLPPQGGRAIALRWAGAEMSPPASALFGVARAADWASFNAACDRWTVPAQNLAFAAADGSTGLRTAGRLPLRARRGLFPLDGSDPANDWQGWLPPERNPRQAGSAAGWLATANDVYDPDALALPVTWLPEPPYRSARIREALSGLIRPDRRIGPEACLRLQGDTVSAQARALLPRLLAALDHGDLAPVELEALRHLDDWNGDVSASSVAATVWEQWYHACLTGFLSRRLEPAELRVALDVPRLNPGAIPWSLVDPALDRPDSAALVRAAFRGAITELVAGSGADPSGWGWGERHTISWRHPAGGSRLLGWLLNRGPYPAPGDGMTVFATEFRLSDPWRVALMPVSRLVIDMADGGDLRVATHPGQSGHPLSPHYDDRIDEFLAGETHQTPAVLGEGAERHRLVLRPA